MDIYNQYNGKLALICFFIYAIMLIKGRKTFKGTMTHSNNYGFVLICMVLYSGLGFMEWDTYHYYRIYNEMLATGFSLHVEPFFYWLIVHLPHSYFLWRFVVWGMATVLMIMTAKILGLNATVLCYCVPLLFLQQLSMTRGSLGLALMIFCAALFIQSLEKKNIIMSVIAILGLVASSYMHKSMIIFLSILVLCYFVPLNKRTFVISLIVFPFLYSIILLYFVNFSFFDRLNEDQVNLITTYQSSENVVSNINGIIGIVFNKAVLLLLLFNITKKYLFSKIEVSKAHFFIYKYAYFLIYISFLFLGQDISPWISSRTLHASSFALVLCATHCFDVCKIGGKRTNIEKMIFIGFLISTLWDRFDFIRTYWN